MILVTTCYYWLRRYSAPTTFWNEDYLYSSSKARAFKLIPSSHNWILLKRGSLLIITGKTKVLEGSGSVLELMAACCKMLQIPRTTRTLSSPYWVYDRLLPRLEFIDLNIKTYIPDHRTLVTHDGCSPVPPETEQLPTCRRVVYSTRISIGYGIDYGVYPLVN